MSNPTNMYQNIEKKDEDGFLSSRKASSELVWKSEKTVQGIELKSDMDIDEKIHKENPYGDLYMNDKAFSDIAVSNFKKIIKEKSQNEDDGFKKEYAVRIRKKNRCKLFSLLILVNNK